MRWIAGCNDLTVWCRSYGDGLLGEAMEEQPASLRPPAIEAEGEFVEIVVEMLALDAALMSSHQPSLQQGGDIVDAGHDHLRRIGTVVDDGSLMLIAQRRQASITAPAIGVNGRSGRGDGLNKGDQTVRRYVCDAAQVDAPNATTAFLRGYDDNGALSSV